MTLEQLESNLSPCARHALETYNIAWKDGDPDMPISEMYKAIRRLYGQKTYVEFMSHLRARMEAVLPQK